MQGTDSIHDMRVVNTDAVSHKSKNTKKCLETAESDKKKNYLHSCLNERRHFTLFFASVEGLLGVQAKVTLKRIASRLAKKWKEPFSRTSWYMKSRVVITIVRSMHCCIQGYQVPASHISMTRPQ